MKSSKRGISAPELNSNNKKFKKTTISQTNTLLNYFVSNRIDQKPPLTVELKQKSLADYFPSDKKSSIVTLPPLKCENNLSELVIKPEETIIDLVNEESSLLDKIMVKAEIESQSVLKPKRNAFDLISNKTKTEISAKQELVEKYSMIGTDEKENLFSSSSSDRIVRKCPFYKRIEGTQITVDAFNYGNIDNCNVYFLSHFHYDHYIGMTREFKNRIICSKITANLVMKKIRVESKYVCAFEMNKFLNVYDNDDSVQVTLLDANHCPGSVMFLFRIKMNGKYILHTGDFRASNDLIKNAFFQNIKIDTIHLDTTYCDSYYKFQPQSKIIESGVELACRELKQNPKSLIVCGSYTIGKERIFIAIAEALNVKVCVSREKLNVLSCLEDKKLDKMLTLSPDETNLHVISMGMLNIKDLGTYLEKFTKYENLIAIKPSGWTHKEDKSVKSSNGVCVERKSKNVIIYGLEYSEHSSFDELKNCIKTLQPKKIIPTVNVADKDQRDKMKVYFNEWLK